METAVVPWTSDFQACLKHLLTCLLTKFDFILAVLQPENATDIDSNADFSHCGANYCPDTFVNSSSANFNIEDKQRYMLFGIYLVSAVLGALLVALTVDPLTRFVVQCGWPITLLPILLHLSRYVITIFSLKQNDLLRIEHVVAFYTAICLIEYFLFGPTKTGSQPIQKNSNYCIFGLLIFIIMEFPFNKSDCAKIVRIF